MRFTLFRRRPGSDAQPQVMSDPVFGELTLEMPGLWAGRRSFAATGREVDVGLVAGPDGPTQAQRDLFRAVEQRYTELVDQYRSTWAGTGAFPDGVTPDQLVDSLQLEYIHIPDVERGPLEWEMTHVTDLNDHTITLAYRDWTFVNDRWDG